MPKPFNENCYVTTNLQKTSVRQSRSDMMWVAPKGSAFSWIQSEKGGCTENWGSTETGSFGGSGKLSHSGYKIRDVQRLAHCSTLGPFCVTAPFVLNVDRRAVVRFAWWLAFKGNILRFSVVNCHCLANNSWESHWLLWRMSVVRRDRTLLELLPLPIVTWGGEQMFAWSRNGFVLKAVVFVTLSYGLY